MIRRWDKCSPTSKPRVWLPDSVLSSTTTGEMCDLPEHIEASMPSVYSELIVCLN